MPRDPLWYMNSKKEGLHVEDVAVLVESAFAVLAILRSGELQKEGGSHGNKSPL